MNSLKFVTNCVIGFFVFFLLLFIPPVGLAIVIYIFYSKKKRNDEKIANKINETSKSIENFERKLKSSSPPAITHNFPTANLPDFKDFVVLDFETTGYDASREKIIEVGALKIVNGNIVDEFTTLVNPQKPIFSKITKINGIDDNMVSNAPTIQKVMPNLINFIGDNTIVTHNSNFNIAFLNYYSGKTLENTVFDTLDHVKNNYELENLRLNTACSKFDIEITEFNRAINDCKAILGIYNHLRDYYEYYSDEYVPIYKKRELSSI